MKIYLVGGAVRDSLLNIPFKDKDYLVVGATPEIMVNLGFKPIGKDFPVFLHPKSNEEYALARTEKKIAAGHKGFNFYASPDVSIEEDLKRRDITINAIAQDSEGNYIDPYDGMSDIGKKIIRHVSPSFQEDPLRVLRVARFKAKLPSFVIYDETMMLMKRMVADGEVECLSSERVTAELMKGLDQKDAFSMLEVLDECAALPIIFPDISFKKHNRAVKKLFELANEAQVSNSKRLLLFLLAVNFEDNLINPTIEVNTRIIKLTAEINKIIVLLQKYSDKLINFFTLNVESQLDLLGVFDFFRRPHRVIECIDLISLVLQGRDLSNVLLLEGRSLILEYQADLLHNKITVDKDQSGENIKRALYRERLNTLSKLKNRYS